MAASEAQQFLKDLDKKLWTAADKLRANLDAAVYKHAVLGLIFLKYVSDAFELRQQEIESQVRDPDQRADAEQRSASNIGELTEAFPEIAVARERGI